VKLSGRMGRTGLSNRATLSVSAFAAIALSLSACSSSVGIAGTVGSTKITINQLQASVDSINAARKTAALPADPKAADLPRNQLRFYLLSALLQAAGDAKGVKVVQSDIDSRRKAIVTQLGGEAKLPNALASAGIAKNDFPLYLRDVAYEALIGAAGAPTAPVGTTGDQVRGAAVQQAVLDAGKKSKVTVNPRYGTWNSTTADITPVDTTGGAVKKK
jgi:hypothetical protein